MVEMRSDTLVFTFPEVHPDAHLEVAFQRTLRIPDDDRTYPLPPGLGHFPLRHVDDFAERLPEPWRAHGGVMLPMYQSEAMWVLFSSPSDYPFAVKVGAGKVNAVTGDAWSDGLGREPQDYLVAPTQPWLDGFCVERGVIRQFVAMPLGSGYSAEEQLTGAGEHGGIQIVAYPLKAEAWRRRPISLKRLMDCVSYCRADSPSYDMGMAPGGLMAQEIYDDNFDFASWETGRRSRCFVHVANALVWHSITGSRPPTPPPTAEAYTRAGLPWFEYYDTDHAALAAAEKLKALKSVARLGREKGEVPLPENQSVEPTPVRRLSPRRVGDEVREGAF